MSFVMSFVMSPHRALKLFRPAQLAKAALITLTLATGACQGVQHAMTYGEVPVARFEFAGENWRIYDDAPRNRLMTTPSFGTGTAASFASGISLGLVNAMPAGDQHRQAAAAYLESTGRGGCEMTEGEKVIKGQFEFVYTCPDT